MEEKITLKKETSINKRANLKYLGFHKFIGMYLIIRMHVYDNKAMPFDFGIRMCELLFISSGFLVGYNYYQKQIEYNLISSIKFTYKHLRSFYPYYLLNLFYGIYLFKDNIKLDITTIELLLINLVLIANWSSHRKIARFYFGISWFLDDIFYCYILSIFLLSTVNNFKNSLKIFFFVALSRVLSEEFLRFGAYNVFDTNFHCGPIIRILEFYMGMLIIPLYFRIKNKLDKFQNKVSFKIIITIIQFAFGLLIYHLFVKYEQILLRCYFVLILCFYVISISFDYGYLSNFLSNKIFKIIMSAQLEMYLIQLNVHITYERYFGKKNDSKLIRLFKYYQKLFIIYLIAYLYRKFLRDKLANLFDKIVFLFI